MALFRITGWLIVVEDATIRSLMVVVFQHLNFWSGVMAQSHCRGTRLATLNEIAEPSYWLIVEACREHTLHDFLLDHDL